MVNRVVKLEAAAIHASQKEPRSPRLKQAKGRFGSKHDGKMKALRMEFTIVENMSGLQEGIFNLSRAPQVNFGEKSTN